MWEGYSFVINLFLFSVISEFPLIYTPDTIFQAVPFNEWGEIFGDEVIAGAILDRLIHHSYIISINGPSWRTKDKMKVKNGVDRTKKGIIIK